MSSVIPLVDAPNTTIQVELSEGIELVGGSPYWQGDIANGQTIKVILSVKVVRTGEFKIAAWATSVQGQQTFGNADVLYVSVTRDTATVSKSPFQSAPGERVGTPTG